MNELFVVSVNYQDAEQEFKARFERWSYTPRIFVMIEETTVKFNCVINEVSIHIIDILKLFILLIVSGSEI